MSKYLGYLNPKYDHPVDTTRVRKIREKFVEFWTDLVHSVGVSEVLYNDLETPVHVSTDVVPGFDSETYIGIVANTQIPGEVYTLARGLDIRGKVSRFADTMITEYIESISVPEKYMSTLVENGTFGSAMRELDLCINILTEASAHQILGLKMSTNMFMVSAAFHMRNAKDQFIRAVIDRTGMTNTQY